MGFTTALAAFFALSIGPDVVAPQNPFAENFITKRATLVKPAPVTVYVESGNVLPPRPRRKAGRFTGAGLRLGAGLLQLERDAWRAPLDLVQGHFENPPRPGAVWVAPHFQDTGSDRITWAAIGASRCASGEPGSK